MGWLARLLNAVLGWFGFKLVRVIQIPASAQITVERQE